MSSILKVDQLQDSGGNNLVTSNGSGVITSAGFGKIAQIVTATTETDVTITTTSFSDIGLSASITPSSTSSKILVQAGITGRVGRNTDDHYGGIRLLRGTTEVYNPSPTDNTGSFLIGIEGGDDLFSYINMMYLDSPSTTSSTTYKVQGSTYTASNGGSFRFQQNANNNNGQSTIFLMEVLP